MASAKDSPEASREIELERVTDAALSRMAGAAASYFSIPLSTLRLDTVTGFDLYMMNPRDRKHILYRGADFKFKEKHKKTLRENGVRRLYINSRDRDKYLRYMEGNLGDILGDESLAMDKKSRILYDSTSQLVKDVFENPALPENMKRIEELVDHTVAHVTRGGPYLANMLNIMSYDYSTYTHSVNVSIFGVALARRLGFGSAELKQLGTGLLLHDVGKTEIDPQILLKHGPLTDDEWKIVRTHPARGVELLEGNKELDPGILAIVHQHHEKCSGAGYPQGLGEEDIHVFAKIAALADVFDALTTRRCYKEAVDSFPAIRIMQSEMADAFNPNFLRELILMMNLAGQEASRLNPGPSLGKTG